MLNSLAMRTGTCPECGDEFPIKPTGRPRKFCGDECKTKASNATSRRGECRNCGEAFTHARGQVRFCPDCRYIARVLPERGRPLLSLDGQDALRCTRCSVVKVVDEFRPHLRGKHGRTSWCRQCHREYNAAPDRRLKALRASRKSKLGISIEDQLVMWEAQGGRCASCGYVFEDEHDAHLDHDHATGRVRAFLCGACNHIVGRCGEDVDHLVAVAEYLLQQRDA
jgi:hypothetical protein